MNKYKKFLAVLLIIGSCVITGCGSVLTREKDVNMDPVNKDKWTLVINDSYEKEIGELIQYLCEINGDDYEALRVRPEDYNVNLLGSTFYEDCTFYSVEGERVNDFRDKLKKWGYNRTVSSIDKVINGEIYGDMVVEKGARFEIDGDLDEIRIDINIYTCHEIVVEPFMDIINMACNDSYILMGMAYNDNISMLELEQPLSVKNGYKRIKLYFDDIDKSDVPDRIEVYISKGKEDIFLQDKDMDLVKLVQYMGADEEAVKELLISMAKNPKSGKGEIEGKNDISWNMKKESDKTYRLIFNK